MGDDHGNLSTVLRVVEYLFGFIIRRIKIDIRLPILLVFTGFYIVFIGRTWSIIVSEGEIEFFIFFFASKPTSATQARELYFTYHIPLVIVLEDFRNGIYHIFGKEISTPRVRT